MWAQGTPSLVLIATILVSACGRPTIEAETEAETARTNAAAIARLREDVVGQEARLAAVREEVAAAEQRAQQAREAAAYEECRASLAEIESEVAVRHARCQEELAAESECRAKQERRRGNYGLGGCVAGIAAAVVTGGSAAPLALGGCAAGSVASRATERACPVPECSRLLRADIEHAVLVEKELAERPVCHAPTGTELHAANGARETP